MRRINSIFSKLFLSYLLIIVVSFLLFIGVFFYLFHINLYKEYGETYEHQYDQMQRMLQNQGEFDWDDNESAEILRHFLNHPEYYTYIADEESRQIFGPYPEKDTQFIGISNDIIQQISSGKRVASGSWENGELRYIIASPLSVNLDKVDNPMMVMVFHDLTHEYLQVLFMILFTFAISIVFAGIVLWFISKKITAPLREMNQVAMHYAKGDFSKSVQYKSNDEIGQLVQTFSYMADELNHLEHRRKEFISNVSHDLRSPLTSIKGFIVALLDGTIPSNRSSHYHRLMKDETERMIKLVNDTLDMTQLEEGHSDIFRTEYKLTEQINSIIHKLEPHFLKKNLDIRFNADKEYVVYADKERIEQVVVNLLQNAIQFSNKNAPIDISLIKEGSHVIVMIQDYGEGIEKDQLDLIWKRFYKVDDARSSKSGFGLGLAIVKFILDLHESEIKVKSKLGEGTIFSFSLPLCE